ncbi:hypothetical protein AVEN_68586-1 [Araneus ventricosus]|uniref:Uncharacterized protein n=1 Tax=Araneus ventricosus TaxID=182803 RepID=A0A4Y2FHA9_ARAVE|nr:hypothetical protein AVEN_68586-1 [Araneus ventricosus]
MVLAPKNDWSVCTYTLRSFGSQLGKRQTQIAKKACLKGLGNLVVGKGKGLSQRFPWQGNLTARQRKVSLDKQETIFSVRLIVRFPQTFITSLFQAFKRVAKSPPSADKIEPLSEAVLLQRVPTPFFIPLLMTSS